MASKLIIASLALALAGCATDQVTTIPVVTAPPPVSVPTPQPVTMQTFQWKVYNSADLKKLAADLDKSGKKDVVIFALTPDGYKALATDMAELQRYINEQKATIIFLRTTLDARSNPPAPTK